MKQAGARSALVDIGGDVRVVGLAEDGQNVVPEEGPVPGDGSGGCLQRSYVAQPGVEVVA